MTVRMSFCLKAVKTLSNQDLGALTDGIESYVKAGMAAKAAERAAVTDLLEQVNGERGEVIGLLRAQHADVFAPPPAPAPVVMKRAEPSTGMSPEDVQTVVDAVTSGWANAPEVVVLGSMADASEAAQKVDRDAKAEGADGATRGYWDGGKVYLVADQLKTDGQVVRVLFHETIGHAGLRGLFGRKLLPILDEVASANEERMQAKATQYGMDLAKPEDRLTVAEEILAEMAERSPEATLVQRAIAAVRQFLRAIGIKVALTDADIVANILVPAREFITNGRGQSGPGGVARSVGSADQTQTEAFKRWFGDSKVVDAQGKPLVVGGLYIKHNKPLLPRGAEDYLNRAFDAGTATRKSGAEYPDWLTKEVQWSKSGEYDRKIFDAANIFYEIARSGYKRPGWVVGRRLGKSPEVASTNWSNNSRENGVSVLGLVEPDGSVFSENTDQVSAMFIRGRNEHYIVGFENTKDLGSDGEDLLLAVTDLGPIGGQIKSATGNSGAFDATSPDIRRSVADTMREGIRGFNQTAARNLFLDITSNAGKLGFWGRTIGTQYAKAQRHPLTFGRVFDAVQDYIKDINIFGNAAADMAPTILPKLESWRDLMKGGLLRHGEATAADLKAAGSAVFQGTLSWARDAGGKLVKIDDVKTAADKLTVDGKAKLLLRGNRITEQVLKMWQGQPLDRYEKMVADKFDREFLRPGVVFTEPELRRMGFSGPQITLYNEFRAAVDQSLTDLAKTEMVRLAGGDGGAVAAQVLAAADLAEAASIINQHFNTLAAAEPDRKADLDKTYQAIADKSTQVDRLKAEGYAPLMRFGPHTLRITRDGETLFFGMYESRREANKAAREMQADSEFKGAEFVRRKMNDEAYKLYAGLPLDALELFASTTGNEKNEVYQDFLRLTKNNRSAMKRMIHRQGIAGFNEDTARVLASFVTSNARMASGNLNLGRAKKLVQEMEKTESDGDLTKDAGRLVQYVQDPQEEAPALRGLLFTQFIGGSVASAATNLTQPITMTLPYLSQFGGLAKATQHLLAAARTVAAGAPTGEIGEALKRAEDDGIVSPQEIHHLQAEAMKNLGNHPVLKKAAFIWGSLFSLSEQFNRRVTFVAAYNAAKETHNPDPFGFAEKAVIETQGLYNRGNRGNWARGPIGATLFTFKQFSIHYLEFLERMWRSGPQGKRAVGIALAVLVLVAGAGGLPFADDLDDAIDTLAQALGYDFSSKAAKRKFVADTLGLGSVAADVATRGLTSLPGFPIDMSLRLSMGNLLPGTGALLRSNTDRSKDVLEFAGAAGGLAKNAIDAGTKLLAGDFAEAGLKLAPTAIQNMAKAMQMWNTGEYRNQREQKVMDTGPVDAAMKFVGFQPAEVARESSRMQEVQRSIQLAKNVEGEIAGKWAEGLNDGDQAKVKEAQRELADWNAKNQDTPMRITLRQVIQRVREMRATRQERTIKSAPREMRERVREQMQ